MQREELLKVVREWIKKAENDIKATDIMLKAENPPYDIICFHAQQASEKYIKSLLIFYTIPFHKTHDLTELLKLLPHDSNVPKKVGDLTDLSYAAI